MLAHGTDEYMPIKQISSQHLSEGDVIFNQEIYMIHIANKIPLIAYNKMTMISVSYSGNYDLI